VTRVAFFTEARTLGYEPQDDAEECAEQLAAAVRTPTRSSSR